MPGNALLRLVRDADADLLLVAPYIKVGTLERVLAECPPTCSLKVVTRWKADELAKGVSDIDIWPLLKARRAQLFLHPRLHAKYYAAGDRAFLGSANLTHAAMGWASNSNLEIITDTERDRFAAFERSLSEALVPVDDDLYKMFLRKLAAFPSPPPAALLPSSGSDQESFEQWRPALRYPEDLYHVYSGEIERLTSASREAAIADLAVFQLSHDLDRSQFDASVGLMLRQHPEIIAIDALAAEPQRFGAFRSLLSRRGAPDGGRAWQTWMRWLLHFLPDDYRMNEANYSEIFSRTPASNMDDRKTAMPLIEPARD